MARSRAEALNAEVRYRLWLLKRRFQHWRRAWHYARNRLTADEAQDIIVDCGPVAGWYSLNTLHVGYTLEMALEEYQDHPALRSYIEAACDYVARKWEPNTDERGAAEDWAIKLAVEYALDDGIVLTPVAEPFEDIDSLLG